MAMYDENINTSFQSKSLNCNQIIISSKSNISLNYQLRKSKPLGGCFENGKNISANLKIFVHSLDLMFQLEFVDDDFVLFSTTLLR